jgi:hypothetical protein
MARFNEILVGRYNRFLQKLFAMKGAPPAPQLSSEIVPSFPLFSGVENRYLEQWEIFSASGQSAAVAGQTGAVLLRNPVGSNVIAVVENYSFASNVAFGGDRFDLSLGSVAADLATVFAAGFGALDSRTRPKPSLIFSHTNSVAGTPDLTVLLGTFYSAGGGSWAFQLINTENQEIPVLPGFGIQLIDTTANDAFFVNVRWRERFLEDSERT